MPIQEASQSNSDVLIMDSAGRNQVDLEMMKEIKEISENLNFQKFFLFLTL